MAIEPIAPRNKIHPELADGVVRPWAVVSPAPAGGQPTVAVYVLFLKDTFPQIAGHLISASVLSIPAAALRTVTSSSGSSMRFRQSRQ